MHGTISRLVDESSGIAKKWARMFPSHSDDFHSLTLLAVAATIDKYGKDVSPSLVRTVVGRFCQEYISNIPVVRIPPTTGRRRKAVGEGTMVQTLEYIDNFESKRAMPRVDVNDIIDTICHNLTEERVIHLRMAGLNQVEVGKSLEIGQQRVSEILKTLGERYNDTKCVH